MEVHHHPDLHHNRKKFNEYFLEFLMIFLAVTMGFFAEQAREHFADEAKVKEYMKEIVENLKYDSIRCTLNVKTNDYLEFGLDSFRSELKEAIAGKVNGNRLYYYALQYLGKIGHAVFNTSAITELKNSGSLRLIENKKLVFEISDYYERKIYAANSFLPSQTDQNELQKNQDEFFSLMYLTDFVDSYNSISDTSYSTEYNFRNILELKPALQLLKSERVDLERFYTQVSRSEIKIKYYNFWLSYCEKAAEKLIADIQNEYHLTKK